ncbi:MAG: ATP-binding protein [Bacteroidales bacterium]|nr:ATP-binding protein [Bacteroidales bacterium]
MKNLINRDRYIPQIVNYIDKQIIKVIVGQRRVGKSYFMKQLIDHIQKLNSSANIIYINKELFDFSFINTAKDLVDYIENNSKQDNNYLFIDEVQEIQEYEIAVRHFFAKDYDIYITGSNSNLLSGELTTLLSGRYIQFRINPLTFSEFCEFHKLEINKNSMNLFIKYGGMPYLKNVVMDDEVIFNYLKNIYQTILLKDVVARYNIKNVDFLERLVLFLSDNLGSIVSAKKISDFLKSQNLQISNSVVLNYLTYIDNAFFINKTQRYDLQGKRLLEIGEKYYFTDFGIRNSLVGFKPQDINKILENVVFTHLISMNYEVQIGKLYDMEIDFIAKKNSEIFYIQVAYILTDEKVIQREFGNLEKIKDNYPKFVISIDDFRFDNYQGIAHISMFEFLQKENL